MLEERLASLAEEKAKFDRLRPSAGPALAQLRKYYDIELTYTSNAIEGNSLTLRETAEVIEHGLTVGGKTLRDHLEAVDHYAAVQWIREQAANPEPVGEAALRELHRRIVARSQPEIAGVYSQHPRRIAGSPVVFPNPLKIPQLMEEYAAWLEAVAPTPAGAFEAHYRLTAIHPFSDGNGRAARLLMNLLLIRAGYPPIAVRPEDRKVYLDSLERASLAQDLVAYQTFMHSRLIATLQDYLAALS